MAVGDDLQSVVLVQRAAVEVRISFHVDHLQDVVAQKNSGNVNSIQIQQIPVNSEILRT